MTPDRDREWILKEAVETLVVEWALSEQAIRKAYNALVQGDMGAARSILLNASTVNRSRG